MTAGIRRNGTSKFGSARPVTSSLLGAPVGQAEDGRDVVEYGPFRYGDETPYDETSAYAAIGFYGHEELTAQAAEAVNLTESGTEGHGPQRSRNARRYTGRHASGRANTPRATASGDQVPWDTAPRTMALGDMAPRDKATGSKAARKRIRRVVPAAAVAATLAAGVAAAYGLTAHGQPQAGNLNTSMTVHGAVASPSASGAGNANEVASAPINAAAAAPVKVAAATVSSATRAPKHAKATPSRTPAASPSYAPKHAVKISAPAATTQAAVVPATLVASPAATSAATIKAAAATTLSCNAGSGLLPGNVTAIVNFLLAHGYSDNAAAGIAGNIYQESKGDPESVGSGGGGLIGWTPLPAGFITGNVTTDLQTQLAQILTYNQVWSQFLPALNSAASPAAAADIYVTDFERAGIPAASTREASAQAVASACGI